MDLTMPKAPNPVARLFALQTLTFIGWAWATSRLQKAMAEVNTATATAPVADAPADDVLVGDGPGPLVDPV